MDLSNWEKLNKTRRCSSRQTDLKWIKSEHNPKGTTLIEPKGANKSPLSPLYKRGEFLPPPLSKGDQGGFCWINVERYLPIL
jgi:hypothetical protein